MDVHWLEKSSLVDVDQALMLVVGFHAKSNFKNKNFENNFFSLFQNFKIQFFLFGRRPPVEKFFNWLMLTVNVEGCFFLGQRQAALFITPK